LASYWRRGQ